MFGHEVTPPACVLRSMMLVCFLVPWLLLFLFFRIPPPGLMALTVSAVAMTRIPPPPLRSWLGYPRRREEEEAASTKEVYDSNNFATFFMVMLSITINELMNKNFFINL